MTDKEYHKKYNKAHYENNKQYYLDKNRRRRAMIRDFVTALKEELECEECGENHPATLDFHHLDPDEKEISIAQVVTRMWSIDRIEKEIDKCIVLCANCHRKLHYDENIAGWTGEVPARSHKPYNASSILAPATKTQQ